MALVARMGLADSIRFHGLIRVDGVAREFASADISLQPSVFVDWQVEGIPNAILEAMATGLPVVGSPRRRRGGRSRPHTGLFVDEGDVEGLVGAFWCLAADPGFAIDTASQADGGLRSGIDPVRRPTSWQSGFGR